MTLHIACAPGVGTVVVVRKREVKDLETMGRLFSITQMGPKSNHMYPYKKEAKGELIHTEENTLCLGLLGLL